jgi:hypothetical protein
MRAHIQTKQACFTLDRLHAELAGKIADNKREAARLEQDMRHVEAVMKLLDPSFNAKRVAVRRRKPNPWFKRGTIFRHALEAMREAQEPLTATEVTARMFRKVGVEGPSRDDFRTVFGGVQASLRNNEGKTVRAVGESRPAKWALI